jgi:hypothetical protein
MPASPALPWRSHSPPAILPRRGPGWDGAVPPRVPFSCGRWRRTAEFAIIQRDPFGSPASRSRGIAGKTSFPARALMALALQAARTCAPRAQWVLSGGRRGASYGWCVRGAGVSSNAPARPAPAPLTGCVLRGSLPLPARAPRRPAPPRCVLHVPGWKAPGAPGSAWCVLRSVYSAGTLPCKAPTPASPLCSLSVFSRSRFQGSLGSSQATCPFTVPCSWAQPVADACDSSREWTSSLWRRFSGPPWEALSPPASKGY